MCLDSRLAIIGLDVNKQLSIPSQSCLTRRENKKGLCHLKFDRIANKPPTHHKKFIVVKQVLPTIFLNLRFDGQQLASLIVRLFSKHQQSLLVFAIAYFRQQLP